MGKALMKFPMIREGDRILVALSGGKDSLTLLHFLREFQKKAPIFFDLHVVHVDRGGRPESLKTLQETMERMGVDYHIESAPIAELLETKLAPGVTACSLCSRLRRGVLYSAARKHGCNLVALGHHRDDLLETFCMNLFFSGKMGGMSPIYRNREGDLTIIRPLYTVQEDWIREFVRSREIQVLDCSFCDPGPDLKRGKVRQWLENLEGESPGLKDSLFAAMANPHMEELPAREFWQNAAYSSPHQE